MLHIMNVILEDINSINTHSFSFSSGTLNKFNKCSTFITANGIVDQNIVIIIRPKNFKVKKLLSRAIR